MKKSLILISTSLILLSGCHMAQDPSQSDDSPHAEQTLHEQLADLPDAKTTDWELILINPTHPLPNDYEKNTQYQEADGEPMDARIVDAYLEMKAAAQKAGYTLHLGSAYRSVEHQQFNYDWHMNHYMEQGMSEADAKKETEKQIAKPGYSEHHSGLALDIVDEEWFKSHDDPYIPEYDTQDSQHWLVEHAPEYGFILRYLKGKENETGTGYESWHFRYVGVENAKYIAAHQLTLEKYLELLAEKE